ncbi:FAD-dependent oxidoreductase [Catenuloplanes indicus]|uniref:Kynurenine 3-monooxygenase n=1 Tax=Catenuloplanes indicus TaxID=137267 RepID=A0AAE3VUT8_9ACTN|nr:NAD(P)/FAD-dependent oxidoreductase [Catenuloplanes indicus]MDQ0364074.1 kynurenine 3-monooxygenase [Catenuloplanes indicus]
MTGPQEHAVVVGAGLAGSLTAVFLARRGYRVSVYERRPDPRTAGTAATGRSINLGLSARGMAALDEAGLLDAVLARGVPMRGRVVHRPDGTTRFQPYGVREHEILHSVLRDDLLRLLVDTASAHPDVSFHFGRTLTGLDRDKGTVEVADPAETVEADLIVGADGVFSAARRHLQHGLRADYAQEFLPWGYTELTIPAGPGGVPRVRLEALHVWPGEDALMVAHPNRDGSLTCSLFMAHEGPVSFAALRDRAAIHAFADAAFPDARELMPDLADELLAHPVGRLVTVRTAPWRHEDRVVLVGDAAHAVYPFFGQGMNAAFEDCLVLDACLGRHPDRGTALAAYEAARRPHTDVLADLSAANFTELRARVHRPGYVLAAAADRALSRLLPHRWVPLYTLVAHTTTPYADALARVRRQRRALAAAVTVGTAVAVLAARLSLRGRAC